MQYNKLGNTDLNVSTLSYGASPLGSVFRNISESEGIRTVHTAVDLGVNLIDVSPYYGDTVAETVLGKALKTVPRDKYILSSKAGRYGSEFKDFDFSEKRIRQSLQESLARLGTDHLDIFLLHDIEFGSFEQVYAEALPCLQKLKAEGAVRYIGVTGYPVKVFEETLKSGLDFDVILTYCRYALHDTKLTSIIPSLKERGIGIINASPTAMGVLTERGAPSWHPGQSEFLAAGKKATELCQKHGVDITQLAMQFATGHQDIASTLVGTANPDNLIKNVNWLAEPINTELAEQVAELFKGIDCTWTSGHPENRD
jgi:L-galactose dehydrogenase